MIPWLVLAFLGSSCHASRPRGIRAEVIFSPVPPFTLVKRKIIRNAFEQLLILWILATIFVWKMFKSLSAGCFIVQPWRRFPMFWRQQHDSLHPSQWRLLWLWGERTFLATFTQSLKWLGWVGRARHLRLSQWQVLLRECWAQGHRHSLRQGEEWKCFRI